MQVNFCFFTAFIYSISMYKHCKTIWKCHSDINCKQHEDVYENKWSPFLKWIGIRIIWYFTTNLTIHNWHVIRKIFSSNFSQNELQMDIRTISCGKISHYRLTSKVSKIFTKTNFVKICSYYTKKLHTKHNKTFPVHCKFILCIFGFGPHNEFLRLLYLSRFYNII